jgi:hypothetical protein
MIRILTPTMVLFGALASLFAAMHPASAWADEYEVQVLNEPAPADELSPEIAATLGASGFRIVRNGTRTVCDLWLCKEWPVKSFDVPADILYPFQPGQLIGVARYARKGADFRDQPIGKGVYTLRYGQQPVDGAHVGTSLTRDFLLLLSAESDKDVGIKAYRPLTAASAEVAGSSHPALLSLQKADGDAKAGTIQHDEEKEWWRVRLQSKAQAGDAARDLPLDLIVIGLAAE